MTPICLILTCGETATFKKEPDLWSISCTDTLAPTLAYKICLETATVIDAGRLGSTATQSVLIQAEILFSTGGNVITYVFLLSQINS